MSRRIFNILNEFELLLFELQSIILVGPISPKHWAVFQNVDTYLCTCTHILIPLTHVVTIWHYELASVMDDILFISSNFCTRQSFSSAELSSGLYVNVVTYGSEFPLFTSGSKE